MTRWRLVSVVLASAVLASGAAGCSDGGSGARDGATAQGGKEGLAATPTAAASATPLSPTADEALPGSMAALGDSMTRAFAACAGAGDCPRVSWSTGSASGLESHAQRIAAAAGQAPETHNLAVSGATVSGLEAQVDAAVAADVDYVTILIGANDACASSEGAMTPVADFDRAFRGALTTLVNGLPRARILVVSIPDLARLRQVGEDRAEVVATWERYGICQSMLAEPRASAAAVQARRDRVRARVTAYNRVMAAACATHDACRSDAGAVFAYRFSLAMVSRADYWHPSAQGQRALADVSWRAGYWPT